MNISMSYLVSLTILACTVGTAVAEETRVPQLVNYQGHLSDATGNPLETKEYSLCFNIYDTSDTRVNTPVWGPQCFDGKNETGHGAKVPVVQGYFNVILGPTDTGARDIAGAFATNQAFLGVTVVGSEPIEPRQRILSAPYAIGRKLGSGLYFCYWRGKDKS